MEREVVSKLESIVGKDYVVSDILDCVAYGGEVVPFDIEDQNIPIAVVKPKTSQEISEILKYANEAMVPVAVHGSGTSFLFSSRPKRKGSIVLSTSRLDSVEFNEDNGYVEVGAGVITYDLEQSLSARGYMFPINTGSKLVSTVGGAFAVNTIGHMVDACAGKPADHALGLEVVLPTGGIIETGTKSLRRSAGIELTKFFVGSEALFGVITKIRMMLIRDSCRTFVAGYFEEEEGIGRAVQKMYKSKLPPPLYGEMLDFDGAKRGFKLMGLKEPKGAVLLLTIIGDTDEEAVARAQRTIEVIRNEKTFIEAHIIRSKEEQEKIWHTRDFATQLLQTGERGVFIGIEVSAPLSRLAELIYYLKNELDNELNILKGVPKLGNLLGHVAATALHVGWALPRDWDNERKKEAFREAFALEKKINLRFEASCGETGLTAVRIPFFKEKYGDEAYGVLVKLKRVLDPNDILNPGNLEGEGIWN